MFITIYVLFYFILFFFFDFVWTQAWRCFSRNAKRILYLSSKHCSFSNTNTFTDTYTIIELSLKIVNALVVRVWKIVYLFYFKKKRKGKLTKQLLASKYLHNIHHNPLLSTSPKFSTNRNSYIAITKTVTTSGNEPIIQHLKKYILRQQIQNSLNK